MERTNPIMAWLNAEAANDEIILQRDGIFAMLTWRDFNQPPAPPITLRTLAWVCVLALALPVLMMS